MSATSSSPLLERWRITTLLPGADCNPAPIADHRDPYWALSGVLSIPILSTLPSLPTMPLFHRHSPCPGASRGQSWCHAAIYGAVNQTRDRPVIFLSPGALPRVESEMWWSSSFTPSAFSRKWSTLGPGSPFLFVWVYVGECTGSTQPIKSDLQERLSTQPA